MRETKWSIENAETVQLYLIMKIVLSCNGSVIDQLALEWDWIRFEINECYEIDLLQIYKGKITIGTKASDYMRDHSFLCNSSKLLYQTQFILKQRLRTIAKECCSYNKVTQGVRCAHNIHIYDSVTSHPILPFSFANSIVDWSTHLYNLTCRAHTQRKTWSL